MFKKLLRFIATLSGWFPSAKLMMHGPGSGPGRPKHRSGWRCIVDRCCTKSIRRIQRVSGLGVCTLRCIRAREQLQRAVDRVQAAGVDVYGPQRFNWMSAESFYFYDLDGHLVELWSPDP